jgi:hypothetical protein
MVMAVAVVYALSLSLSNERILLQVLFDRLLEEKALELAMDVDVGEVGKGETLVYCLLLVCIIYCEEMVSIAEKKERTQEMRDRRENCVKSFLLGYENLLVVEINNRREKQR